MKFSFGFCQSKFHPFRDELCKPHMMAIFTVCVFFSSLTSYGYPECSLIHFAIGGTEYGVIQNDIIRLNLITTQSL